MDIKSFKKKKIDLSSLGFIQNDHFENYYCTPKNAKIIAASGVDGIHFCTIPQFGEMIFAVSPMNFGDCVHPIARNFEDLLRLLLDCGDVTALEQCYAWDEEQYKAFIRDCSISDAQQAVLNDLKYKCCLEPIENFFEYVKQLQSEFDLSQIPYTEDYYDIEMNPNASDVSGEWAVYFDGGFWNKNVKGRPCEEIVFNKKFSWDDKTWHIPAIYSCSKGLVIDFCVEIQPEKVKLFVDKWYYTFECNERLSHEIREQMEFENPMDIDFKFELKVNEKNVVCKQSSSISWIPENCLPDGVKNESESRQLISHYGLDETRAWIFQRYSCLWATQRKPQIKSVKLELERNPTSIKGIKFKNPSVGDEIKFIHPIHNTEHKLTVISYEKQEFPINGFQNEEYEFPKYHTAMEYTLEPDLSDLNFKVCDCVENDSPKRIKQNRFEPKANYDACVVAVIGGSDGPTALFTSASSNIGYHVALSALHFEYVNDIEWKIVFSEKLIDGTEIDLI